jgi:hypothetical protein
MATVSARDIARSDPIRGLGRAGLAARATIYLLIAWLALLIAQGSTNHEADQRGALEEVATHRGGFAVITLLAIGLCGYALWRWSEFAFGVVGDGRSWGARLKSLFRGGVYAFFAVSALQILLHDDVTSQAHQQQQITATVMHHRFGRVIVAIAGVVVIGIGAMMIYEGVTRKFKKYFDFTAMGPSVRRIVWVLGTTGTVARGIVFVVTGVFVVRAATTYDATKARGLDTALRSVAEATHGQLLLTLLAAGLACFALYGYAEAAWRRT